MAAYREEDFGVEIAKILPAILREVTKRQESVIAQASLAVPHIIMLDFLSEKGKATMSELSSLLNLSMSSMTSIVDRLIAMELVDRKRSDEDRRVVNVVLTDKGKTMAGRVNQERIDMTNDMFSALDKEERKEYLRLIRKVYDNLGKREKEGR